MDDIKKFMLLILCLKFIEKTEKLYSDNKISKETYENMIKIKLNFIKDFWE